MIDFALNEISDCTGCYSCKNICPVNCISMTTDQDGFWYPYVNNDSCLKCEKCLKACPVLEKRTNNNKADAYACYNKDEEIRMNSSSGGVFTLVAENFLNNHGVVYGAVFTDEFKVEHHFIEKKEELYKLRGSKYVQSRVGRAYDNVKSHLEQGKKVLFSGTPCQVGGLKSFLDAEYENLVCVDIVCHGVPSPKIWDMYLEYQKKKNASDINNISFRDKVKGWKRFSLSIFFEDASYSNSLDKDPYMKIFLSDLSLRPSCYNCKFKTLNRESDITLADFWGVHRLMPDMDDDKGTSLILVNTKKGRNLFEQIKAEMIVQKVDINEAIKFNLAAIKSSNLNEKRDIFMMEKENESFEYLVSKYCKETVSTKLKTVSKYTLVGISKRLGLLDNLYKILDKRKASKG